MSEQNSSIPPCVLPLFMNPAVQGIRGVSTLTAQEHQLHENILNELAAAFFCPTKQEAWKVFRTIETYAGEMNLVTETFLAMDTSLKIFITWENQDTEYTRYPVFEERIATVIPGATIVPPPFKHRLRPDFFVEREGMVSPVEIKRNTFTGVGVKQLQRYMTVFNCVTGYAIAPKLSGTLLPGMMFIQWDGKDR